MTAVIGLHANDLREMTDEEIPTQFVSERRTQKESSRRRIFDVILGAGALRIRGGCVRYFVRLAWTNSAIVRTERNISLPCAGSLSLMP